MRAAYVDMIGGASGNMLIGACVDAGADVGALHQALETIPVTGWSIRVERVVRKGIAATYVDVVIPGEDDHRGHPEAHRHPAGRRLIRHVLEIFDRSGLTPAQKARASRIAMSLAHAEAGARGLDPYVLPFHAVGQIDAIIDIAGTCICLDLLEIEGLFCSPFPVGSTLPNETARLIKNSPTRKESIQGEMVTTTGAAILCGLVIEPGRRPSLRVERVGYGAGRSDFQIPNVTRIEIGEIAIAPGADRPYSPDPGFRRSG